MQIWRKWSSYNTGRGPDNPYRYERSTSIYIYQNIAEKTQTNGDSKYQRSNPTCAYILLIKF